MKKICSDAFQNGGVKKRFRGKRRSMVNVRNNWVRNWKIGSGRCRRRRQRHQQRRRGRRRRKQQQVQQRGRRGRGRRQTASSLSRLVVSSTISHRLSNHLAHYLIKVYLQTYPLSMGTLRIHFLPMTAWASIWFSAKTLVWPLLEPKPLKDFWTLAFIWMLIWVINIY